MSFYNRRNAAVGYLTLKALQRSIDKRRKRRSGMKVAAYVGLGLVSAGILAAALAIVLKRRQSDAEDASDFESDSEIVGEYVTAPEPVPAT
jgi:DMSO reductase anchor subunit